MNLKLAWLKSLIRFPVDSRRAARFLQESVFSSAASTDLTGAPIVVELHTPQLLFDCGRHLNCLAAHARAIGSPFYLRSNRLLLAAVARKLYGGELLRSPDVIWQSHEMPLPKDAVIFTDRPSVAGAIEMMIGRDVVESPVQSSPGVMPYPMHHRTLHSVGPGLLSQARQNTNRGGLFFAGRLRRNYTRSQIKTEFGVMDRIEVVRTIRDHFAPQIRSQLRCRDPAGGATDSNGPPGSIVLLDATETSIPADQWLPTLSQFGFFLACPGVCQPMCHNVIEAMSVGTIPVIQYTDRFSPALQPWDCNRATGEALVFSDSESLVATVRRLERMPEDEVAVLRRNVIEYYDRHLCGANFLRRVREATAASRPQMISLPFHRENFFTEARAEHWRRLQAERSAASLPQDSGSRRHGAGETEPAVNVQTFAVSKNRHQSEPRPADRRVA